MKKQRASIFHRYSSKALLFVLALLLLACAGTTVSQSNKKGTATPALPSDPVQNPTPIEQTAVPGSVMVQVTLVDFKILSTVTTFRVGVPYHFVVSNRSTMVHEFMITLDKPDGTSYPSGEQDAHAIIHIEVVNPGTTINVNYTFLPTAGSRYEMACQMRGHYAAGMWLKLVVTRQGMVFAPPPRSSLPSPRKDHQYAWHRHEEQTIYIECRLITPLRSGGS